ncbi:MAG: hypothetical protein AB1758_30785, partial [Candidatus Eremiobacterota bacterium]
MLADRFALRWHRFPHRRARLVRWKIWLLLAEHCPPFAYRFARLALQAEPRDSEGWWQLALRFARRPQAQSRALLRVLRREPLRMDARLALIRLWHQHGRLAEAERLARRASRLLECFPGMERERRDLQRMLAELWRNRGPEPRADAR